MGKDSWTIYELMTEYSNAGGKYACAYFSGIGQVAVIDADDQQVGTFTEGEFAEWVYDHYRIGNRLVAEPKRGVA
jgi:hypothetical protein